MIKMGIACNVIDDETLQIRDLDDELYEVKGSILYIDEIRERLEDEEDNCFVEFDDETMEMVV